METVKLYARDLPFLRALPATFSTWLLPGQRNSYDVDREATISRLRKAGLIRIIWDETASSSMVAVRRIEVTQAGLDALAAAREQGL